MDLAITGKRAVVTGASEGIGYAIALGLAREGAHVAICGRRQEQLEQARHTMEKESPSEVLARPADLAVRADVESFFQAVLQKWKGVDILVNNVGRAVQAPFEELSEDDWQAAMDTNLSSARRCTELALPYMKAQRWGRIINVSAVSGKQPTPNLLASNVAKSALISFSKSLSNEVGRYNVLVNCVCPGRILSPQIRRLFTEKERQTLASTHIPLRRFGEPEEFANLVVFLASEQASYITGTTIQVDGGLVAGLL